MQAARLSPRRVIAQVFADSGFAPGDFDVSIDPAPTVGELVLPPTAAVRSRTTGVERLYLLEQPAETVRHLVNDLALGRFNA